VDIKRIGMIGGTVLTAAAIGYFMQNSVASSGRSVDVAAPVETNEAPTVPQVAQSSVLGAGLTSTSAQPQTPTPIEVGQAETNTIVLPSLSEGEPSDLNLPRANDTANIVLPKGPSAAPSTPAAPSAASQASANQTLSAPSSPKIVTPLPQVASAVAAETTDDAGVTPAQTANTNACAVRLAGSAGVAATVDLLVDAPCHPNQVATLVHDSLVFTLKTDENGSAALTVPVLTENAVFLASFMDGQGGLTNVEVSSVGFYDRAVLLLSNGTNASLHAREFNEGYETQSHVQASTPRNAEDAATGEGGFLVSLGDATVQDAGLAEVYTFPSQTTKGSGDIRISVEVEITPENCGQNINAQVIQIGPSQQKASRDLMLQVPGCDAVGDRLIIAEAVDDIQIRPEG